MSNNEFNAAQKKAITHFRGPAMVLAGPGSGKTRVIVERLKFLIEEKRVPPSSILVITFTKAAAMEMQYRFLKITDSSYPEVCFGTFHSVFYQIIKQTSSPKDSRIEIATESFKYEIIRDTLSSLKENGKLSKQDYEDSGELLPDIISEISRIKNMGADPLENQAPELVKNCFFDIFRGYNKALLDFGRIDFDDMIERCYRLLLNNSEVLKQWQERFEFILIDEYQDINPMQQRVVELLCREHKNLFVVGDDDQSIYGFRGSDPGIMLGFSDAFQDIECSVINLDINYRCGKEILETAIKVIDENTVRFKKDLKASALNGGGRVYARKYENKTKQYDAIVYFLKKHMDNLSDIALLFRTNSEATALSLVLKENDIPSNLEERNDNLLKDRGVKLCYSYLCFAFCGYKRSDFLKIMNQPMRYISRDAAGSDVISEREILAFYRGNPKRQSAVKLFFSQISILRRLRPNLAVRYIRKSIGIDDLFPESKSKLDELMNKAGCFPDMKSFIEYLGELEKDLLTKKDDKEKNSRGNRVKLMTMHGSKGLEFDYVWLPDLNEGIIPSRSATGKLKTEEERRMLYVAMTRAKKALIMSYITGSKDSPMLPTRFIKPIKRIWDESYKEGYSSSEVESSSGSSTSSSNSASSR